MPISKTKYSLEKLIEAKEEQLNSKGFIQFSRTDLQALSKHDAQSIEEYFQGRAMMDLPTDEINFFEWLQENDPLVWDDLWKNVEEPYRVSLAFLHHFIRSGNGFPICDLINVDNYWFHSRHIKPKALEKMDEIQQKLDGKGSLSFEEGLLLEIARGSIDLWHFCYKYKLPLVVAKKKIEVMHQEDLLVHLKDREDLVKYLDV
jgi:hypothetical protein